MYPTLGAYQAAVADQGVKQVKETSLARRFPSYRKRSRAAFSQVMVDLGLSRTEMLYRGAFYTYVNPTSQGMWCSWCEALSFLPNMAKGSPTASSDLFLVYVKSINQETTLDALQQGTADPDTAGRWVAWQRAHQFWAKLVQA